jgi:hypothetical protein
MLFREVMPAYIENYSKYTECIQMFEQTSIVMKKYHINICPKMPFLSLINIQHSTINALTLEYVTYNCHIYVQLTFPV